MFDLSADFHWP